MRAPVLLLIVGVLAAPPSVLAFSCSGTEPTNFVTCSNAKLASLADGLQRIYNKTPAKRRARTYRLAESNARTATDPSSASTEDAGNGSEEVALKDNGGVFQIPVQINGAVTLPFVIDSGASDVQITFDVFSTLLRTGTIVPADMIGKSTYTLADGSKHDDFRFLVRELKVGRFVLHNVPASIGSAEGNLLLGQSFLKHFDSWTLDNRRHVLQLAAKAIGREEDSAPEADTAAVITALHHRRPSLQSAVVCGRPVEYTLSQDSGDPSLLGVWSGTWNNSGRLCGGLVIQRVDQDGTADLIYVYGPTRASSRLSWTEQHRMGVLTGNILSFHDNQGSTFRFSSTGVGALDARFIGGSGDLRGTFEKVP
jgi:clan AA aspartic protease (TIGR02281 family)